MKRSYDQSKKKNQTKNNDYYNEVALNKVKNKYEESIQFQWIHLIAKKYNIFNIDNSHQCFIHNNSNSDNNNSNSNYDQQQQQQQQQQQSSVKSRKLNSNVIIPFPVVAPNFYGCIICGKYHFCNIDRRVCEIISDESDKIEMCRYSGKVLLVQDNLEPNMVLETQRMNATRDALTFEKYVQVSYMPKGVKEKSNVSNKKMIHTKKKQKLVSRLKNNELEKKRLKNKLLHNNSLKSKNNSFDTSNHHNSIAISYNCDISIDSISEEEDNNQSISNISGNYHQSTAPNISIIEKYEEVDEEEEEIYNNEYEDSEYTSNNIGMLGIIENNNDDTLRNDTPDKPQLYLSEFDCELSYSDEDFLVKCYSAFDDDHDDESFSTEHSLVKDDQEDNNDGGLLSIIKSTSSKTISKHGGDGGGDDGDTNNMNIYIVDENDNADELGLLNDNDIDDYGENNNDGDDDGGGAANGEEYKFIDTGCGGAFTKNYHNNLEYNNRYYSFINTIIRKWKRKNDLHDLYNRDIQFESKTIAKFDTRDKSGTDSTIPKKILSPTLNSSGSGVEQKNFILSLDSSNTKNEFEKNETHKYRFTLTENAKDRIRAETEKIVTHLLDIHKKVNNTVIDTSDLNISLVYYFTTLINNITSLIYGSDKINTIATVRNMKNQKQQKTTENLSKLLVTTIDLNEIEKNNAIREHEYTLDPKRICRSLMYSLLIEPFALNDSFGNRIDIWFRDPWLYTVNKFHSRTTKERKEISKTNNIIAECLASYNWCPVWVRSVVFNNIS